MFPLRFTLVGVGNTIEEANYQYVQSIIQFAQLIISRNQDLNDDLISESHSVVQDQTNGKWAVRSHIFIKSLTGDYDENGDATVQTEFTNFAE